MSYVNDNRRRLETRVGQLLTGVHYAQTPPSPMRRVIANLEFLAVDDEGEVTTAYNFVLHELSVQATGELRIWAGRATHRLRRVDGGCGSRRRRSSSSTPPSRSRPSPSCCDRSV